MKKQSIRKKIFQRFIVLCGISLIISSLIAIAGMLWIRNTAVDGNNAIGREAAQTGGNALLDQVLTTDLVESMAQNMDQSLQRDADMLRLLAEQLTFINKNQQLFQLIPFNHIRFNTGNTREMQWMLSPGMTIETTGKLEDLIEAGVMEETFLVGNMQTLFETVMSGTPNISSIYITTKSGVNIDYDDNSLLKISDDISTDAFEFRTEQSTWYYEAAKNLELTVTDTYQDMFGRGLCITLSMPYFGEDNQFIGVVGMDILISDLSENILQTSFGDIGYAVLLSVNEYGIGKVIAAPGLDETNEKDIWLFLGRHAEDVLKQIGNSDMGVTKSAQMSDGTGLYIIWAPIELTDWTFLLVLPEEDIIAPSEKIRSIIDEMTVQVVSETGGRIVMIIGALISLTMGVLLITALVASRVSVRITDPIMSLVDSVKSIGEGDLEYSCNISTGDEVEELSLSFERMTISLKEYIKNLARITAEKERIGAELDVATKIQAGMLPCIFPPFPTRGEFDIFASMQPAKEVGGDFYDFFLVDENTLAVVMADVSDKGVPAALFMVIAKTLIKNNAQANNSPKEVFEIVNNMLCENNEAGMFVTAILGYLDIPGGRFTFVNAGHNPPLLQSSGKYEWLKTKPDFILAGMEGIIYNQHEVMLKSGDTLFLYTDGLTEAVNNENELFTDPRLLLTANKYSNLELEEFTTSIKKEVDDFATGAEQADDITMLVLRYGDLKSENQKNTELTVEAKIENIGTVLDFVNERLGDCPDKVKNQIGIVIDEIYSNIAKYAYHPGSGDVTVAVDVGEDVVITFTDSGIAHDPLSMDDPDVTLSAEEREIGGLGIFMVKKIMNSTEYKRNGNKNILTVKKRIE
jgi:sigma-B regulation protein RsbU (phosphoserine phosphatase)